MPPSGPGPTSGPPGTTSHGARPAPGRYGGRPPPRRCVPPAGRCPRCRVAGARRSGGWRQLARCPSALGGDHVAGHAEQPADGATPVSPVGVRRLDHGQEYLGGEVGGRVRIADPPDDEPGHRVHMGAVERFEGGRIVADTRKILVTLVCAVHISSRLTGGSRFTPSLDGRRVRVTSEWQQRPRHQEHGSVQPFLPLVWRAWWARRGSSDRISRTFPGARSPATPPSSR